MLFSRELLHFIQHMFKVMDMNVIEGDHGLPLFVLFLRRGQELPDDKGLRLLLLPFHKIELNGKSKDAADDGIDRGGKLVFEIRVAVVHHKSVDTYAGENDDYGQNVGVNAALLNPVFACKKYARLS